MRYLVAAFLLAGFPALGDQRQLPSTGSPAFTEKAGTLIASIHLPKAWFKDTSVDEVIPWLQRNSRMNGHPIGITYSLRLPKEDIRRFSGDLSGGTLPEALDTICSPIHLYWWVDPLGISIGPKAAYSAEKARP